MSASLSYAAAGGAAVLGLYGSYANGSVRPALIAAAFAALFAWALYRAASPEPPRLQVLLALGLVCLSFALHMVYLPAGICCFFCLMLCKNELLLPAAPRQKAE